MYGWCEDGDERFLYMERIKGLTVEECWLSVSEKPTVIAEQLNLMISSIKRLKQAPENSFFHSLPTMPLTSVPCLQLIPNRND